MNEDNKKKQLNQRASNDLYLIYWEDLGHTTAVQGAQVTFGIDGHVRYENPNLSPETIIRTWYCVTDYGRFGMEPELPILEEGRTYRLQAHWKSEPKDTAVLQIVFLDRMGKVTAVLPTEEEITTFTYPADTSAYKIELIQGGATAIDFDHIELWPADTDFTGLDEDRLHDILSWRIRSIRI